MRGAQASSIALLLVSLNVCGQDYTGRAALSASHSRGNVHSSRVYGDADFTARTLLHRYALSAKLDRRSEAGFGTSTAWRGGASYDRFLDAKRFAYARTSVEHDRAKDIHRRSTAGFGYGAELYSGLRGALSVRGGLDYVDVERLAAADERYPALGWGVKASHAPWGERLELFHEQEGFWNLQAGDALSVRSKSGMRMPLVAKLSATAQVSLDWESRPAPGLASTDATLLLGVDYAW